MSPRTRHFLATLLLALLVCDALRAGVTLSQKSLGSPSATYASILEDLDTVTFVVITYYDGSKATVSDPEWIIPFKRLLASADGKPDESCLCITFPRVTFANKLREIVTMEIPHGAKFRFYDTRYLGDFLVDRKIARLVAEMLMIPQSQAIAPNRPPSAKHPKAPTPNPLSGMMPSIPDAKH